MFLYNIPGAKDAKCRKLGPSREPVESAESLADEMQKDTASFAPDLPVGNIL